MLGGYGSRRGSVVGLELLELVEHLGELRVVEVAVGHVLERRNQHLGLLDVLRAEVGELRHLELRAAAAA